MSLKDLLREQEQANSPKIGEGAAAAMLRAGLKELTQVLPAFPDSNVRPIEEPGAFGNLTSREVYEQKHETGLDTLPSPAQEPPGMHAQQELERRKKDMEIER